MEGHVPNEILQEYWNTETFYCEIHQSYLIGRKTQSETATLFFWGSCFADIALFNLFVGVNIKI